MNDSLRRIMSLPPSVVAVAVTSDGHYLAREAGDCGFSSYLGKPTSTARSRDLFNGLPAQEQEEVRREAEAAGIKLEDFIDVR